MDLNVIAVEEMEKAPCIFREEQYNADDNEYEFTCSLTTTVVAESHPRYSKECDPTTCPIWKTYIMQLIAAKNFNIQKQEKNKND